MHTKRFYQNAFVLVFIFLLSMSAIAQGKSKTKSSARTQYGVGFQATFPAYGLSGMMDITDKVSAQAILGFFGSLKTYAARGLYRFKKKNHWNVYGYGMLGAWSYTGTYYNRGWRDDTETVIGFGVGAGFEYDWRGWDADFPPIFWNLEVGLGFANFDRVGYNFSTFLFGGGVHYRF